MLLLLKFCSCDRERGKATTRIVLFPLTAFSQGSIVPGVFARRTLVKCILALNGSLKVEDWLVLSVSAGSEFEAGLDAVLGFVQLPSGFDLKT